MSELAKNVLQTSDTPAEKPKHSNNTLKELVTDYSSYIGRKLLIHGKELSDIKTGNPEGYKAIIWMQNFLNDITSLIYSAKTIREKSQIVESIVDIIKKKSSNSNSIPGGFEISEFLQSLETLKQMYKDSYTGFNNPENIDPNDISRREIQQNQRPGYFEDGIILYLERKI